MILLFLFSSILLFLSGIVDSGIMLKGHPNDIRDSKSEAKTKSIRIRQLGYVTQYKICDTCFLKSNNCSSCKNEFYLIKGGEYEINCVENCPNDTVKYEENKTCLYFEYNTTKTEEQGENKLDLFFWGFILGIAFLLLLLNMIFFCRFCCCKKGEDNLYKEIQTELSEDLVIN